MPKAHRIIPRLTEKDISRFWAKVDRKSPVLCWEWTAFRNGGGYGRFVVRAPSAFRAHRIAWVIANGSIPEGLCVCHRCDNPPCVNPAHLFLAAQARNIKDMVHKGRRRGPSVLEEEYPNAKLTAMQVREIRTRYASGGITQRELAAEYKVDRTNVQHVIHRRTWRHLD